MGVRIRIGKKDSSGVKKAVIDAEEAGYDKGYIEGYGLAFTRYEGELTKVRDEAAKYLTNFLAEREKSEFNQKLITSHSEQHAKAISMMQVRVDGAHKLNSSLKERLADRNRELTRARQTTSSAVGGALKRRNRRKKNLRSFMKESDDGFY